MNNFATNRKRPSWLISALCLFVFKCAFHPDTMLACSVCYGEPDSAMAKGLNWGIVSLFGVVMTVLGGIAAFFIYMARRSTRITAATPLPHAQLPITTD